MHQLEKGPRKTHGARVNLGSGRTEDVASHCSHGQGGSVRAQSASFRSHSVLVVGRGGSCVGSAPALHILLQECPANRSGSAWRYDVRRRKGATSVCRPKGLHAVGGREDSGQAQEAARCFDRTAVRSNPMNWFRHLITLSRCAADLPCFGQGSYNVAGMG